MIRSARNGALGQGQTLYESQHQPLAAGDGQSNAGASANDTRAVASEESYDPNAASGTIPGSDRSNNPPASTTLPSDDPIAVPWHFTTFGELKPATYTPTQHIGNFAASALMGLGMQPYYANDLTSRVGNLLGLTPLRVAGAVLNFIDAKRHDDFPGVLAAASGMIPGAKGVARGIAEELHHPWPKYLGGAVKQELVSLPKALHYEFHRGLDKKLPKWLGTAHYEKLGPIEKQQALQVLAAHAKDFDAAHGTKLYDALLKNGFPAP
jgi:hypothetical protein